MSKRAEEAAWQLYPDYPTMDGRYVSQRKQRELVMKGYEQAEKDLALTWEDVKGIEEIINSVRYENPNGIGAKLLGEEVLRRFNERRENK